MTIDELIEEWSKDSDIDGEDYDLYSKSISKLHSKYLGIRTKNKIALEKLKFRYNKEKEWFHSYYTGEFNTEPEELERMGKKPFNGPITTAKINSLIASNEKLNDILLKINIYEQVVYFCDQVIIELKQRTYALGNSIKWKIFIGGK